MPVHGYHIWHPAVNGAWEKIERSLIALCKALHLDQEVKDVQQMETTEQNP